MLVPRTGKKGKPERYSDSEGKNFLILKKISNQSLCCSFPPYFIGGEMGVGSTGGASKNQG